MSPQTAPSRLRILLIDDEPNMRAMMANALGQTGEHTVTLAENAMHGLDLLRDAPHDLLVTDVGLPGMSALDMIDQAHAEGLLHETPIVVCTASHWLKPQAIQRGARFIRKPCRMAALASAVDAARARLAALATSSVRESWRNLRIPRLSVRGQR